MPRTGRSAGCPWVAVARCSWPSTTPTLFQIVGAHSPSLHLDDGTFSLVYGTGTDFAEREPIDLAANAPGIESLQVWVDAGEDDPWLPRDELIHQNLLDRGVAHGWDVLPGGHDGSYWTRNLPMYLHYYDRMLHGAATTVRLALAAEPVDDATLAAPDAPALAALPDVDSPIDVIALPDVDSPILTPDIGGLSDVSDDQPMLDPGDLPADPLQPDDSDWTPAGDASGVPVFSLGCRRRERGLAEGPPAAADACAWSPGTAARHSTESSSASRS